MKVTTSAGSHRGRVLPTNEDSYFVDDEVCVYAVADGVGGNRGGDVASKVFCDVAREHREVFRGLLNRKVDDESHRKELLRAVDRVFQEASGRIYRMAEQTPDLQGMATTGDLFVIGQACAVLGHVGDGRGYLCRGGEVDRLTTDHTLAQEMVASGLLAEDEISSFVHRNVLARAVGQLPTVRVDALWLDLADDDSVVLCTDGFYRHFAENELWGTLENGVDAALRLGLERGGQDNLTVVHTLVKALGASTVESMDMKAKVVAFQKLFLFKYLNYQELVRVLKVVYEKRYEPGQTIVREGDLGDELFMIAKGSAAVIKDNQHLTTLETGAQFGEIAFMDGKPRSATIRALERSTLLCIKREDFRELTRTDPVIATKLLWCFVLNLAGRVRGLSFSLVNATKKSGEGK